MAAVQTFALAAGVAYLAVGVLGFIPGITQPPPASAPDLAVEAGYGYLLGLFPINVLHNLVHLAIGAWGAASYRSFDASRLYARGLAVLYGLLTILGLVPGLNTTLGLIPIFGHDVWLHALTAAAAAYFGWTTSVDARRPARAGRA
jgi:hypothetical protein